MISFFRTLRHRLLAENRLGKYLLYAAGEISLVVIGILIALQINSWNDDILEREAAVNFYRNTRDQLMEDRENIEGQIAYNGQYIGPFETAIQFIESGDRDQQDSLSSIASNLADYSDFDRQGNIYETIVASGDVRLLKNNQIKKLLRNLEETYLYVNRIESIHLQFIMELMPELLQTIRLTTGKAINEERLYGPEMQNFFAVALRIMGEKAAVYRRALREIDATLAQIEAELNLEN